MKWELVPFAGIVIALPAQFAATGEFIRNPCKATRNASWDAETRSIIAGFSSVIGVLAVIVVYTVPFAFQF